jgi:D-glycero-alpha-D-manno-heptose 1-phosphate guanylyltransferase
MKPEAIVLAGGLGTRLADAIPGVPKALAEVAGRPFLAWQLEYLMAAGFGRVVISVGFRGGQIVSAIGHRFGDLRIDYAEEATPLGTGGAIRHAFSLIRNDGAHVFNGDTLAVIDVHELSGRAGERLVLGGVRVEDASRYGALEIQGRQVTGFAEKGGGGPACINAGVYWLARNLLDDFPSALRFSFEEEFLRPSVGRLRPRVVVTAGPMIDIGTPGSLAEAHQVVPNLMRAIRTAE